MARRERTRRWKSLFNVLEKDAEIVDYRDMRQTLEYIPQDGLDYLFRHYLRYPRLFLVWVGP